jgi:hypothetical protein
LLKNKWQFAPSQIIQKSLQAMAPEPAFCVTTFGVLEKNALGFVHVLA